MHDVSLVGFATVHHIRASDVLTPRRSALNRFTTTTTTLEDTLTNRSTRKSRVSKSRKERTQRRQSGALSRRPFFISRAPYTVNPETPSPAWKAENGPFIDVASVGLLTIFGFRHWNFLLQALTCNSCATRPTSLTSHREYQFKTARKQSRNR